MGRTVWVRCRGGNGVWRRWKPRGDGRSVRKGEERRKEGRVFYFVFCDLYL